MLNTKPQLDRAAGDSALNQMYNESEFEPSSPNSTDEAIIYTVIFEELLKLLNLSIL